MSLNPEDHEFDQVLTDLYTAKQYTECVVACKEKLKEKPLNLQALLYMADISLEKHELDDCIHYCDTIIRGVDERIFYVWCWRGQALCLQTKYDEAVDSFEQSLKYNPAHSDTWSFLALTLFVQDKKAVAIQMLDMVEEKIAELKGCFTIARGYIERADGNRDEALMQFIQGSMTMDPTSKDYEENKEVFATEVRKTLDKE